MAKITKVIKNGMEYSIGGGDMAYSDYTWVTKTGTAITLDMASIITPTVNFTVNAPSTIKDGQTYILRVNNSSTTYAMTLGTNITNPYAVSTSLTAGGIDQFVFLAINGTLELQPEMGSGSLALDSSSPITVSKFWVGTEAQYSALSSYDDTTVYMTV